MIQIKNRYDGTIIFTSEESKTLGEAVKAALAANANLSYANLSYADLSYANLSSANLSYADLSYADLSYADLSSADLSYADLSYANLSSADLSYANLSYANLSSADLSSIKNGSLVKAMSQIVPEVGAFEGFKKLAGGVICHLRIPADAKRVGGLLGRKCRASKAEVLSGEGNSSHDPSFLYKVGQIMEPKQVFNDSIQEECASGIHFFLTRIEAENYLL